MANKINNLNNFILKLSKTDYIEYLEELEKIMNFKKDEYSNIYEILESYKKKKIHLSFLLFTNYRKWIFPIISYNNIIKNNNFSSESKFKYLFNKLKQNKIFVLDEQNFIIWHFYLLNKFF